MSVHDQRRRYMVESQLRTNKVTNTRVLIAFEDTPKEDFVTPDLASFVYIDEDLMLGGGRFMLEPMVFARLVQALALKPNDSVLDIGAASGYSTAILARLCQSVVGIESDAKLAKIGQVNLTQHDIDNAVILHGALAKGFKAEAPYDAIIIEGSVADVPTTILEQLSDDGRLVTIQRDNPSASGRGVIYGRVGGTDSGGGGFAHSTLFDAQTPMLDEFTAKKTFVF